MDETQRKIDILNMEIESLRMQQRNTEKWLDAYGHNEELDAKYWALQRKISDLKTEIYRVFNESLKEKEGYGMRPLSVMGRQVAQSRFSYLASIANAFPECRSQVQEMSLWVRDVDDIDSENYPHRETLKANLMRSVYDITQCINRNA
jgi:hypothetical protein